MRTMEMPLLRAIRTTLLILAALALPAGLAEAKGGHGGGHGGGHHGGGHHGGHHGRATMAAATTAAAAATTAVGTTGTWPTMEGVPITHQGVITPPSRTTPGVSRRCRDKRWSRIAGHPQLRLELLRPGAIGAPAMDMATRLRLRQRGLRLRWRLWISKFQVREGVYPG